MKHLIRYNEGKFEKNIHNIENCLLKLQDYGKLEANTYKVEKLNKNTYKIKINFPTEIKGEKLLEFIDIILKELKTKFKYVYIIGGNIQIDIINLNKNYIENSIFEKLNKLLNSSRICAIDENGKIVFDNVDKYENLFYVFSYGYTDIHNITFEEVNMKDGNKKVKCLTTSGSDKFLDYIKNEMLIDKDDIIEILINYINKKYNKEFTIKYVLNFI